MTTKILIINSVIEFGSTGKIVIRQAEKLAREGHEVCVAFGRKYHNLKNSNIQIKKIGNKFDVLLHGILSRLFGKCGTYSKHATAKFLKWADVFNPDVLLIHNLHGYYIDVVQLFKWIKKRKNMKVCWTLHDCWAFTGHCTHFSAIGCDQWKTACAKCPQTKQYPKMLLGDDSKKMFDIKKQAFLGANNLTLIAPSKWLANLVRKSFLNIYDVRVEKNEIDKTIFKKTESNFRPFFEIEEKTVLMSAANKWNDRKGLLDCIKLIKRLDSRYAVILVGLTKKQIRKIYQNIGFTERFSLRNGFLVMKKGQSAALRQKAEKPLMKNAAIKPNVNILYHQIDCMCPNYISEETKTYPTVICTQRISNSREMAKLYSSADIFFNCTLEDNYPTVNLEAVSCGCIVVTYDVGGCAETIECAPSTE